MVLLLHRPEYYDPNDQPGIAEVIVAKNRNGPTGSIKLTFLKNLTRFENLATIAEPRSTRAARSEPAVRSAHVRSQSAASHPGSSSAASAGGGQGSLAAGARPAWAPLHEDVGCSARRTSQDRQAGLARAGRAGPRHHRPREARACQVGRTRCAPRLGRYPAARRPPGPGPAAADAAAATPPDRASSVVARIDLQAHGSGTSPAPPAASGGTPAPPEQVDPGPIEHDHDDQEPADSNRPQPVRAGNRSEAARACFPAPRGPANQPATNRTAPICGTVSYQGTIIPRLMVLS